MRRYYIFFLVALLALLIDQISKKLIVTFLQINETFLIIPKILHLTYATNTGAAFSLFKGQVEWLLIISIVVSICIIVYFVKLGSTFSTIEMIGWSLLLGGTIGNLIDRLLLGKVIDFIDVTFINFPIFNFADIFIDLGAFTIIVLSLLNWKNDKQRFKSHKA